APVLPAFFAALLRGLALGALLGLPLREHLADVPLEDLGQVVARIKLVFVADAGEDHAIALSNACISRGSAPRSRHRSGWHVKSNTWWRCAASKRTRFIWESRSPSLWTSASSRMSSVGCPASRSS